MSVHIAIFLRIEWVTFLHSKETDVVSLVVNNPAVPHPLINCWSTTCGKTIVDELQYDWVRWDPDNADGEVLQVVISDGKDDGRDAQRKTAKVDKSVHIIIIYSDHSDSSYNRYSGLPSCHKCSKSSCSWCMLLFAKTVTEVSHLRIDRPLCLSSTSSTVG